MTTRQAANMTGVSLGTVRRWCREEGIASKRGGTWDVDRGRLAFLFEYLIPTGRWA